MVSFCNLHRPRKIAFSRQECYLLYAIPISDNRSLIHMLAYTDLKKGTAFIWNDKPYEVLESSFSRMQQRKAVVSAKIMDLTTGKILETSFQPSNQFQEADIEKRTLNFLYYHRGEYVFSNPANPKERFVLDLKVTETPPGVQGDRAQGGTKAATLETVAGIQVPLFINQDDIVRVNTETSEYAERMEKA